MRRPPRQVRLQRNGFDRPVEQLHPLVGVDHPRRTVPVGRERPVERHELRGRYRTGGVDERERAVGVVGDGDHGAPRGRVQPPAGVGGLQAELRPTLPHERERGGGLVQRRHEVVPAAPEVHLRCPRRARGVGPRAVRDREHAPRRRPGAQVAAVPHLDAGRVARHALVQAVRAVVRDGQDERVVHGQRVEGHPQVVVGHPPTLAGAERVVPWSRAGEAGWRRGPDGSTPVVCSNRVEPSRRGGARSAPRSARSS